MSLDHLGLWGTLTLVLTAFVALFDFQNLLSWRKKFVLEPLPAPSGDFTIIIPLYGSPKYFERRDRLEHLKGHVVVAIEVSRPAMRAFAEHLEGEGWRVFRALVREPNPPKMLRAVLEADAIHTTYAVRLDADTVIGDDLPNAVAAAQADGADLCSVKVLVHNRTETVCARFQALEYKIAMLTRHYRPWLISGACVVAKTTILREILRQHSMSPIGEDIEMGRVAVAGRMRIRHLDIVTETDAPASWRAWFRQRKNWWAGTFRHAVVNFDRNAVQLPWWGLYNLSILWMTIHLHVWTYGSVLLHPSTEVIEFVVGLIVLGCAVTLLTNWRVRSPLMLVFPLYAIAQSALIMSIGGLWYAWLVAGSQPLGRYRFSIRRRRTYVVSAAGVRPGAPGPYAYQWQCSDGRGAWTDVPGEVRRDLVVSEPVTCLHRVVVTARSGVRVAGPALCADAG